MTGNFKGLSETKALDLMTHAFQKQAITQMIYLIRLMSIASILASLDCLQKNLQAF